MKHLHSTPARPSERLGQPLPADLEDLVMACLAKDRADRPQRAADLRRALDGCADAGRWTCTDSERWWREHGEAEPGEAGADPDTIPEGDQQSVTIDWQARLPAVDEDQTIQDSDHVRS